MTVSITFDELLNTLSNADAPLPAAAIYSLSNISEEDRRRLASNWGGFPVERRRLLMERISEATETNFDMDFGEVTRLALTDLDDEVREIAIESTWIDDSTAMCNRLITMASADISPRVRAAAVSALGRFILQGELEEFDAGVARQAQNLAIKLFKNPQEDLDVRRRALEAVSNCSRPGVADMIEEGYASDQRMMRISAIYGMGRSYDHRWTDTVLREMQNDDSEIQFEAARAAGELEIKQAIPILAELISSDDREILEIAVWSLGEIGGMEATRLLEDLHEQAEEREDESLMDAIQEALETASLSLNDLDVWDDA